MLGVRVGVVVGFEVVCSLLLRVPHQIGDGLTISGDNPHLTSRFCEVVLGPTTISKINAIKRAERRARECLSFRKCP
jgi:hypothetical protein